MRQLRGVKYSLDEISKKLDKIATPTAPTDQVQDQENRRQNEQAIKDLERAERRIRAEEAKNNDLRTEIQKHKNFTTQMSTEAEIMIRNQKQHEQEKLEHFRILTKVQGEIMKLETDKEETKKLVAKI